MKSQILQSSDPLTWVFRLSGKLIVVQSNEPDDIYIIKTAEWCLFEDVDYIIVIIKNKKKY